MSNSPLLQAYKQGTKEYKIASDNYEYGYQHGVADERHRAEIQENIEENVIKRCAEIIAKMPSLCGGICPIKCEWGTEQSCIESWEIYLAEQIREQKKELSNG